MEFFVLIQKKKMKHTGLYVNLKLMNFQKELLKEYNKQIEKKQIKKLKSKKIHNHIEKCKN